MSKPSRFPKNPQAYGSSQSQDRTFVRATVHSNGVLTSNASGDILVAITLDPSTGGNSDWADFSSTYDEFRVMGVEIVFSSISLNANNANYLGAIAFDNDSSSAPSNLTAVRQYATSTSMPAIWTTLPIHKKFWRPQLGVETPIMWNDVANPSGSLGSIQIAFGSLSVSTQYLSYHVNMFLEFRGRR